MTRHHYGHHHGPPPPHGEEWGFPFPGGRPRRRGPGPWGPGPFGPGGPFGPWEKMFFRGRGGWRSRGPRVGRGDVRSATLALLAEQPLHGYQIIQEISERSGGVWRPSPGSVYPMLQQLEDEGLVEAETSAGRRVFHLTGAGREYVEAHRAELDAVWSAVAGDESEDVHDLRSVIGGIMAAVWQVFHTGSDTQIAEAARVLAATRRQLYQILADGEPGTDESADESGDEPSGDEPGGPDVRRL